MSLLDRGRLGDRAHSGQERKGLQLELRAEEGGSGGGHGPWGQKEETASLGLLVTCLGHLGKASVFTSTAC